MSSDEQAEPQDDAQLVRWMVEALAEDQIPPALAESLARRMEELATTLSNDDALKMHITALRIRRWAEEKRRSLS